MYYLIDKNNTLGARYILYFVNYKMVIVVLSLHLKENICFNLTERVKCSWCLRAGEVRPEIRQWKSRAGERRKKEEKPKMEEEGDPDRVALKGRRQLYFLRDGVL